MTCRRKPPLSFVGWAIQGLYSESWYVHLHKRNALYHAKVLELPVIKVQCTEIRRATPPKKKAKRS